VLAWRMSLRYANETTDRETDAWTDIGTLNRHDGVHVARHRA